MTIQERFMHIELAKKTLGTTVPWIAETMDNDFKEKYVFASNPEFIFAPDGKIVHRESWSRGTAIRAQLEKLVGKSTQTTAVEDLTFPEFKKLSDGDRSGLVQRVQVSGIAQPLKFVGGDSKQPFYCKLRPESDQQLLQTGKGQLYLGFHLDPIHNVKWNNLAAPLEFELTRADGTSITKQTAKKLDVETDGDPREFLVDIDDWKAGDMLDLKVMYFACSKTENWCKPVSQTYKIALENNPAGGRVNGRTHQHGGVMAEGGKGGKGKGKGGKAGGKKGGGKGKAGGKMVEKGNSQEDKIPR